jgi:hypothetical protein
MRYFKRQPQPREDLALIERGWWIELVPDGWQIWAWQPGCRKRCGASCCTGKDGCVGKWVAYDRPYWSAVMAENVATTELETPKVLLTR